MHQTIFEYLCIFCPLYVIHFILQRKEILCLFRGEHLIMLQH